MKKLLTTYFLLFAITNIFAQSFVADYNRGRELIKNKQLDEAIVLFKQMEQVYILSGNYIVTNNEYAIYYQIAEVYKKKADIVKEKLTIYDEIAFISAKLFAIKQFNYFLSKVTLDNDAYNMGKISNSKVYCANLYDSLGLCDKAIEIVKTLNEDESFVLINGTTTKQECIAALEKYKVSIANNFKKKFPNRNMGMYLYPNSINNDISYFVGDMLNGLPNTNASGEVYFSSGSFIKAEKGDFINGNFDKAFYRFSSGNSYRGKIANWQIAEDVNSSFTYANGDVYYGSFVNNKKSGFGKIVFKDGSTYIGNFKEDQYSGEAIYTDVNGELFAGYFIQGKKDGIGYCKYSDGATFAGVYYDNKANGSGVSIDKENWMKLEGEFKNGEFSSGYNRENVTGILDVQVKGENFKVDLANKKEEIAYAEKLFNEKNYEKANMIVAQFATRIPETYDFYLLAKCNLEMNIPIRTYIFCKWGLMHNATFPNHGTPELLEKIKQLEVKATKLMADKGYFEK
jgi:hypothetical protein